LFGWLLTTCQTVIAAGSGDFDWIVETSDRLRTNQAALKTWSGTMLITDTVVEPAVANQYELTTEVEFAADVAAGRYVARATCLTSTDTTNGVTRTGFFDGVRHATIDRPDEHITLGPLFPQGHVRPSGVLMAGAADQRGWSSYTQHPLTFLRVLETPVEDRLRSYADLWEKEWFETQVSRVGDLITVTELTKGLPEIVNTLRFDWSRGGSLVEFRGQDPLVQAHWSLGYAEVSGVWVLAELTIDHQEGSSGRSRKRHVIWSNSVVNQPIPSERFSLEGVEAPAGTVITDHVRQQLSVYKAEDVPPKRAVIDPVLGNVQPLREPRPINWLWWLNGLVLCGVCGWGGYRWYRNRAQS
jgi:hypothetical protein